MNKDIKEFIIPKAQVRIATKQTINLCTTEARKKPVALLVIGIVAIAAVVTLVAKFGVIDQYARLNAAEKQYHTVHKQTEEMREEAARFKEVRVEYLTYTASWMNETTKKNDKKKEAQVGVDRVDVLDMVDRVFASRGTVYSLHIYSTIDRGTGVSSDLMKISVSTGTLNTVSEILAAVKRDPLCEDANLLNSSTDEKYEGVVHSTFVVYLNDGEDGEDQ